MIPLNFQNSQQHKKRDPTTVMTMAGQIRGFDDWAHKQTTHKGYLALNAVMTVLFSCWGLWNSIIHTKKWPKPSHYDVNAAFWTAFLRKSRRAYMVWSPRQRPSRPSGRKMAPESAGLAQGLSLRDLFPWCTYWYALPGSVNITQKQDV